MAGRTRSVDVTERSTAIMFHNGADKYGAYVQDLDRMMRRFDRYSGGKLKDPMREFMRNSKRNSGVAFYFPASSSKERTSVGFCTDWRQDQQDCTVCPKESALKLGIITR